MAGRIALPYGKLSLREYTEHEVTATKKADRPEWGYAGNRGEDLPVVLSLYEDDENGLCVLDIEKYENWLIGERSRTAG